MSTRHPITGSEPRMVEVIPGRLWQSGRPVPMEAVDAAGINVMVSVGGPQRWIGDWMKGADLGLADGLPRCKVAFHAPLMDGSNALDPVAANAVIAAVVLLLGDPYRRVLIHCDAGSFRSCHIAACVLAKVEGVSGPDALERVDEARHPDQQGRRHIGLPGWIEHLEAVRP